jgi:type IV pilus assembly protein PilO
VKKQVSLTAVLAVGLGIVLAVGAVLLVKPQREESSRLDGEIAALEAEVAVASRRDDLEKPTVEIDYADLFRLGKAMPDGDDMPGIILELDAMAASTGVKFLAIQPQPQEAKRTFRALPILLTFQGNYYDLTDFLYRVRSLVSVRDKTLDASGRLYTLDTIEMHEAPEQGFPMIEAQLTLSAYAFGLGTTAAAAEPAPGETAATTTTTPASTEPAPAATAPAETQPGETTTEPTAPAPGTEALTGQP